MKTILLLRHGKSDWGTGQADFDRSLAKRGRKDAPKMGKVLQKYDLIPDLILSSPAKRAAMTSKLFAEKCGCEGKIQFIKELYRADYRDQIHIISQLDDSYNCVLLVGHNPTMEETAAVLCAGPPEQEGLNLCFPTCALACLDAGIDNWAELSAGDCLLRWLLIPRLINCGSS